MRHFLLGIPEPTERAQPGIREEVARALLTAFPDSMFTLGAAPAGREPSLFAVADGSPGVSGATGQPEQSRRKLFAVAYDADAERVRDWLKRQFPILFYALH